MPPGYSARWSTPLPFLAHDGDGNPLPPGRYLAVLRHGGGLAPLTAPLTIELP